MIDDENDSPFAHIPEPGVAYERPSATTPEGEIAFFGAIARGATGAVGSSGRRIVGIVALLLIVGFGLIGMVAVFFGD